MSESLTKTLGEVIRKLIQKNKPDVAQYVFNYSTDFGEEFTAELVIKRKKLEVKGDEE